MVVETNLKYKDIFKMRNLSHIEIQHVCGAGFQEDVTAASAVLYIAIQVGTAAKYIAEGFILDTLVSNMIGVSIPIFISWYILYINPEMNNTLMEKFHLYFG